MLSMVYSEELEQMCTEHNYNDYERRIQKEKLLLEKADIKVEEAKAVEIDGKSSAREELVQAKIKTIDTKIEVLDALNKIESKKIELFVANVNAKYYEDYYKKLIAKTQKDTKEAENLYNEKVLEVVEIENYVKNIEKEMAN